MHIKYNVETTNEGNRYIFYSEGNKGIIVKIVEFQQITPDLFNIGLGDLNEFGEVDDIVNSNNGDMRKVMNTVGYCISDFLDKKPNAQVYFEGNTPARMKLYIRLLLRYYEHVSKKYYIKGFINDKLEEFENNKDYEYIVVGLINS